MEQITLSPELSDLLANHAASLPQNQALSELDFPPELLALKEQALDQIDRTGLTVINNLTGDPDALLVDLMLLVGQPIQDKNAGPIVMDLKPIKHEMTVETTSFYSWNEFSYHTDLSYVEEPPDFIAVYCVQPDHKGGGGSIFSDLRVSAESLSEETIHELQKPNFTFRAPPHYKGGNVVTQPVLTRNKEGNLTLKVRFDRMKAENPAAEEALQELYKALDDNQITFLVNKNSAYIVDNRRVVHGRTPFTPTFDDRDRHLKRILAMR